MPKLNPNQMRLPLMFDVTDPRQKAAYDILKNAGYGKRTPIVVDALLDSLKTVAPMPAAMPTQSGISVGLTEMDVRRIVQETMESVLDSHNLTVATPSQPMQPVQAPSTVETIQYPAPPAQGQNFASSRISTSAICSGSFSHGRSTDNAGQRTNEPVAFDGRCVLLTEKELLHLWCGSSFAFKGFL